MKTKVLTGSLQDAIDLAMSLLEGEGVKEICNISGLSASTVYNLKRYNVSLNIRYGTVLRITRAAGLQIEFNQTGVKLYTAK